MVHPLMILLSATRGKNSLPCHCLQAGSSRCRMGPVGGSLVLSMIIPGHGTLLGPSAASWGSGQVGNWGARQMGLVSHRLLWD